MDSSSINATYGDKEHIPRGFGQSDAGRDALPHSFERPKESAGDVENFLPLGAGQLKHEDKESLTSNAMETIYRQRESFVNVAEGE